MKTLILLIGILSFSMISCNSSRNMVKLTGVKWVLETLDGKPLQLKETDSKVYIQFNDVEKRANGLAGCNRFFGAYEMDGKKLKFSEMGATRMACPDMEIESVFFKMLENTDSYVIKDRTLSLMQGSKVLAVFKSEQAEEKK